MPQALPTGTYLDVQAMLHLPLFSRGGAGLLIPQAKDFAPPAPSPLVLLLESAQLPALPEPALPGVGAAGPGSQQPVVSEQLLAKKGGAEDSMVMLPPAPSPSHPLPAASPGPALPAPPS